MSGIIRDSALGQLLRLITRNRVLRYPEEIDPSIWQKYINLEKTANMAAHGSVGPPRDSDGAEKEENSSTHSSSSSSSSSPSSSATAAPITTITTFASSFSTNELSGRKIDPEKGRDAQIVDWYGPDDEEVGGQSSIGRINRFD